jgi:uncharacterized membrane protein
MTDLFWENRTFIVFLHVISAVIWVGGMIAMRYATHQSLMHLESRVRLERVSHALKRLFTIAMPSAIIIIITAVIMAVGLAFRAAAVGPDGTVLDEGQFFIYNIVHVKEAVWMLMVANLGAMMYLRAKAAKALIASDLESAKAKLGLIGKYMVPVNIALGVAAIYMGVFLRHTH